MVPAEQTFASKRWQECNWPQESMGPIVDPTKEDPVSAGNGIIMARQWLCRAALALKDQGIRPPPGVAPAHHRVRPGVRQSSACRKSI